MELLRTFQQWPLPAIAAIIAGLVILVAPRVLNYTVAAYLIFIGVFGLLRYFSGGDVSAQAVVALAAGVLVLIKPAVLSYVVGGYLILVGLLQAGILRF
jgi:Flp pilus assembly protein protease CpaA